MVANPFGNLGQSLTSLPTTTTPTSTSTNIQTRNTTSYLTVLGEANVLQNDTGVTQAELGFYRQNLQLQMSYVNNLEQFLGPNSGINFATIRTGLQDRMTISGTITNNFASFAGGDLDTNTINGTDVYNVAARDGNINTISQQDITTPAPTVPAGQFSFSTNDVFSVAGAADSLVNSFAITPDGTVTQQELQQYISTVGATSQGGRIAQALLTNFAAITSGSQSFGGTIQVGITPTNLLQTASLDGNPFNFTSLDVSRRTV